MNLQSPQKLRDNRSNCISLIYEINTADYLQLINSAYEQKGGLSGQREPLKSSSALRIRRRMIDDIVSGTVLPPIVVGTIVDDEQFASVDRNPSEFIEILENIPAGSLTIIDGMQRTTALIEAIEKGARQDQLIRVEFWVATKLNSLIYRMLILNTGQVPWNLRRQIETVFSSMINELRSAVPEIAIHTIDDNRRISQAGQYHADDIVELYLSFGTRKEKVDTKERLADEFTRLDFIEVTEDETFATFFYDTLKYLGKIDIEFSKFNNEDTGTRFSKGQDLFKSQPARVGFITAMSKRILGRAGIEKSTGEKVHDSVILFHQLETFANYISTLSTDNTLLGNFLSLPLLQERLSIKSGRVGDFEREFFTKAFDTLIDLAFDVPSLEVCWRAY